MKKIDLPLLTDTIFMASVSLLFFFCLFRYYLRSFWASLACALAAAGGVAAAAYFLVRRKHRKRQEAGLSSAEIAKLTFHLAMEAPERAVKRLADALSAKHGAQAKILGNRIRAGGTDYYPLFQLEPVSADRLAPIVRAEGDKKAIAAGVLTPDAESLALAFGIAVMNAEESLRNLLYRELDLCEFLGKSEIRSAFAVVSGGRTANVLIKLADGKSVSIECSAALPEKTSPLDRHEIIARRGIACDRVVDTQVPQSSIYLFRDGEETRYTDIDSELYGLENKEIWIVRAAFAVVKTPAHMNGEVLRQYFQYMREA